MSIFLVSLYIAATLGGLLLNGSIPLFYELAVEATYPIAEGTTTGILILMNNVSCMIFLFLPMIKVLGTNEQNNSAKTNNRFCQIYLIIIKFL